MKKDYNRKCPICKNEQHSCLFKCNISDFDKNSCFETIRVAYCKKCGFILNDTNITEEELSNFYSKESPYLSATSFGTGGCNQGDINRYEKYLSVITKHINTNSKICDVGCAKGGLLNFLKSKGYKNIYGTELDPRLVEQANSKGLNVKLGSASDIPLPDSGKYDCLIFSHVFEHLLNFDNILTSINNVLNEDGLVFIEVPDVDFYNESSPFAHYWFIATKEHINHFSIRHLPLLMNSTSRFEIIKSLQSPVAYNNNKYSYPSLMMLFQKKQNIDMEIKKEFDNYSISKVKEYIQNNDKQTQKHSEIIDMYIQNQKPIFCWGIGAEFFTSWSNTNLSKCNIISLIDNNAKKQKLVFHSKKIASPDILKTVNSNGTVFIFSVFNSLNIKNYLDEINFKGEVLVFE